MLKKSCLVLAMLGLAMGAFAQADVYSPYSVFGVGQMADKSMNVKLKGRGGLTNAMFGKGIINTGNPASYAMIDSLAFLFDAGFYFKTSTFSTSVLSEQSANASFDHAALAFGITSWWKMALAVQPYSSLGYKMVVNSFDSEVGNYTTAFQGSGGLNRAVIGNAFKIGKHIAIGANVSYVFGDSESLTTLYFPDSLYKISTRRGIDLMVSSFKFDYGLLFTIPVGEDYTFSVGATYEQAVKLKGKQTNFFRTIAGNIDTGGEYLVDTIVNTTIDTKLSMPQGFGLGVAFEKNNRWSLGADFNWTQWSKFAREGANDDLCDAWRVTLGGEFTPVYSSISGYFRRVTYRLGGFFERTYLNINGHKLNKIGVSAGASLPLPKTKSKVDLAVEVGMCGTRDYNLIQENYIKMDVGFSMFEYWFIKRKYK